MSLEKTEFKKAVLNDVGADVDDMLEAAQAQVAEHRGAKKALRETGLKFGAIAKAVDDDLKEGVLDLESPLQVAEYAKKQVQRCVEALLSASAHEGNLELSALGAVTATKVIIERVKKKVDAETKKAEALVAAETAGAEATARPLGAAPAPSVAAMRKAEEAKPVPKGKKGKTNGAHPK